MNEVGGQSSLRHAARDILVVACRIARARHLPNSSSFIFLVRRSFDRRDSFGVDNGSFFSFY